MWYFILFMALLPFLVIKASVSKIIRWPQPFFSRYYYLITFLNKCQGLEFQTPLPELHFSPKTETVLYLQKSNIKSCWITFTADGLVSVLRFNPGFYITICWGIRKQTVITRLNVLVTDESKLVDLFKNLLPCMGLVHVS